MIILTLILILQPVPGQEFSQVDSDEFRRLISEENGVLLDVRTAREFNNGHITDAGNLNFYAMDFRKKLTMLPFDGPIYLYCNTGYRSEKAAEILIKYGYNRVYNLEHGIMEWELKELQLGSVPYLVLFDNREIRFSRNGSVSRQELMDVFDNNIRKHTE